MPEINEYDAIDDIQSEEKIKEEQKRVSEATFSSLGEAPIPSRNGITFTSKANTDLYALLRKKKFAVSMDISPSGTHFVVYGSDRKIRLFDYKSGKLINSR